MKEALNSLLDVIQRLKSQAFKAQNEALHTSLSRAMANLIKAKEQLS